MVIVGIDEVPQQFGMFRFMGIGPKVFKRPIGDISHDPVGLNGAINIAQKWVYTFKTWKPVWLSKDI